MKYIKSREDLLNKIRLNESFLNPEGGKDIEVEWEDTLVGSLLNKIYGGAKNKVKNTTINNLAKKLDSSIAKLFLSKAKEEGEEVKDVIINAETETIYNDVDNILENVQLLIQPNSPLKLDATKKQYLIEGIDEVLGTEVIKKDTEVKGYLEAAKQFLLDEHVEDEPLSDKELETIEKGTKILIINQENEKVEVTVTSEHIENNKFKVVDENNNEFEVDSNKVIKIIEETAKDDTLPSKLPATEEDFNNLKKKAEEVGVFYDKLVTFMASQAKTSQQKEVLKKIENFKTKELPNILKQHQIDKEVFDEYMNKLDNLVNIWKKVENVASKSAEATPNEPTKENYEFIFEKDSSNKTVDITKTKLSSNIDKVKELVKKRKESYKVTKEEVEKVDDAVKTSSKDIVNGEDFREIINTMQKAKDAILRNDFSGIKKRQKPYYIDISNNMGLHKSSYDAWSKRVNNIVAYYKDLLPNNLKKMLLDSLDYDSFKHFPKLVKEYLGVDIKETPLPKTAKEEKEEIEGKDLKVNLSKDNTFVSIDGITLKKEMPFMMKAEKGFIVALPIYIDSKMVIAKYKSNDTAWLHSYSGSGSIIRDSINEVDDISDENSVKIIAFIAKENGRIEVGQKLKMIKYPIIEDLDKLDPETIKKDGSYVIRKLYALYDTKAVKTRDFKAANNAPKTFDPNMVNYSLYEKNGDSKLKNNFIAKSVRMLKTELLNFEEPDKTL